MDPISTLSTFSSLLKSAESIDKLFENGKQLAKDDAKYYSTYIEAASEAIRGLEGEYLGILIQAAKCNLSDQKERKALEDRIKDYINGEVLRPRLKEAIERLRAGRLALQQHAEQLLIWPTVKEKRTASLKKFDDLLNDLDGYLGSLGGYVGPSAAALDDIKKIQADLSAAPLDPKTFADVIGELLMNLDKSKLISDAGNCGRVIESLRIAFR
jgi:hypothetical protein